MVALHLSDKQAAPLGAAFSGVLAAYSHQEAERLARATGGTVLRRRPDGTLIDYRLWQQSFAHHDDPAYCFAAAYYSQGAVRLGRVCADYRIADAEAARMQVAWGKARAEREAQGLPWRNVGFCAYELKDGRWQVAAWR